MTPASSMSAMMRMVLPQRVHLSSSSRCLGLHGSVLRLTRTSADCRGPRPKLVNQQKLAVGRDGRLREICGDQLCIVVHRTANQATAAPVTYS